MSEPAALTAIARRVVDEERARLAAGADPLSEAELADAVVARLDDLGDPGLTIPPPVVNATGVVLHTNLGRAPWPRAARARGDRRRLGLRLPRAGRGHRPARAAVRCRGGAPGRAHRRRGRARGHQQRGGAAARGGAGGAARVHRRLARGAGGDRRRGADPGDRGPGRRAAGGGGDHEPDPPRGLRGGAGRRAARAPCCACTRPTSP